jgi:hypothetical protein
MSIILGTSVPSRFSLGGVGTCAKVWAVKKEEPPGLAARGCRRQRLTIRLVKLDRFLDDLAQFVEDLPFIVAVPAALDQAGSAAYVALVLVGPGNDLHVSRTLLHLFDSSMARRTP